MIPHKRMNLLEGDAGNQFTAHYVDDTSTPIKRRGPTIISHPLPVAIGVLFFLLVAIFVGGAISTRLFAADSLSQNIQQWSSFPFPTFASVANFLHIGTGNNENQNRINILLLGIGGAGHDGPLLTDTMMIASIDTETKRVGLLSIPRDLTVKFSDNTWRRINNANAIGETNKNYANGADYTARLVEETFGIPIRYYVRIDFAGFEKLIDLVGGVDVTVKRTFTDPLYPAGDNQYDRMTFQAGPQHFDGTTALIFARSRHGNNNEGSDFARAHRQQLILQALRQKALSWPMLLNPKYLVMIFKIIEEHIATNAGTTDILRFASLAKSLNTDTIHRVVLNADEGGDLVPIRGEDGAYLLQPKGGDYSLLKTIAQNLLTPKQTPEQIATTTTALTNFSGSLIVQNGTFLPGLASSIADHLITKGFTVIRTENASARDIETPILYDFTNGKNKRALMYVQNFVNAKIVTDIPADVRTAVGTQPPDYVLVLGTKTKITN